MRGKSHLSYQATKGARAAPEDSTARNFSIALWIHFFKDFYNSGCRTVYGDL